MSEVLTRWNRLAVQQAVKEILPCCSSAAWADGMVARRPFSNEATLLRASDEIWGSLPPEDWMEAFRSHPRIGESRAAEASQGKSAAWSEQEQQKVAEAGDAVKVALAEANRAYEKRFGHTFIVCATGRPGSEILEIVRRRLQNDKETELNEAAGQQRQITHIRLTKWLSK
jgi:2-oxo-4-hydroxy-4-carboxy-5-ureidoimidazoline decarboxylase